MKFLLRIYTTKGEFLKNIRTFISKKWEILCIIPLRDDLPKEIDMEDFLEKFGDGKIDIDFLLDGNPKDPKGILGLCLCA